MTFNNLTTLSISRPAKRRMEEDEWEKQSMTTAKRYFDQQTIRSPSQPAPENPLPSLTYASPDYRPPTQDNALWLQPINTNSPMSEDDSNDEDDPMILTPLYQENTHQKPIMNYWGKTVINQWQ